MFKLLLRLLYTATVLVEGLIITQIVLTTIAANLENSIVSWIMNTSQIFISPFAGITANALQIDRFTIPLTPLVALLFYIIATFILSELLKTFSRE